jgi:hypothetical protein
MVEGARHLRCVQPSAPSVTPSARHLPVPGRIMPYFPCNSAGSLKPQLSTLHTVIVWT